MTRTWHRNALLNLAFNFFSHSVMMMICLMLSFQEGQAQKDYIFVWDVTSSMIGVTNTNSPPGYGYSGSKDIFESVKLSIINHINSFEAGIGMIRIIPFRERVLSSPGFELTSQGKEMAKSYVRSQTLKQPDGKPDPSLFSNTNICGAFMEAMSLINANHETVIYLYTDGEQNMPYGGYGADCLRNIIYMYCNKFGRSEVFTFLISLNNSLSRVNLDLSKACDNVRIFNIEEGRSIANISFIKIKPSLPLLHFNPACKKNAQRQIFKVDGGKIPADFSYDAILTMEETGYNLTLRNFTNLTIGNNGTTFELLVGSKKLPERMHGKIKLMNPRSNSNAIIHFQPDEFDIEISTAEPPRVKIIGFEPDTK